jgi:uncharacterized protein
MLITKAHLLVLQELATGEAAGHAVHTLAEDEPQEHIYRELELQGLVGGGKPRPYVPRAYRLTDAGREALGILAAMRKAAGQAQGPYTPHPHPLPLPFEELKNDWRFLGSDILAALHAAQQKKGRVGPLTAQALSARGLTESVHDTLEKQPAIRLNQHGEAWIDFANRYPPRLEIHSDLANSIRHMHPGYTGRPDINMPGEHISLLEVMDLLTWSVPERTIYALTELGRAVYEALLKEGYAALDTVLDEPILEVLALLVNQGSEALTSEQLLNLQTLGYVELDGTVSAAGQAAIRAYSLLVAPRFIEGERPEQIRTFAITEPETELLAAVKQLTEPASSPQLQADKKTLHRVLVDRTVKRYQELVGRYGRTLEDRLSKKRRAVALLEQLKDHDEWFNTFWDLDELLVSLEAFDLLRTEVEETKTVYRLTPNGHKILAEQQGSSQDITATAVKVLTTAVTRFHAPADSWVEQAREEGLIGTGGVSKLGRFYADLAEHCVRIPALTREEAEVLVNLPETVRETGSSHRLASASTAKDQSSLAEEKQGWALEKLEARGLIERLVDGQVMRTEAGQLLAKAVSGAMQLGHPVTPAIVRLLIAIRQVGTLYVKEQKVRMMPHNWAEVERLTGLGPQEFKEAVHVARMGHYIGEANITEAGLDLLAVQEQLNR